jgi:hypothetical protein
MMSQQTGHSSAISPEPVDEHVPHQRALLDELGITAKPHVAYEWNGYRYTNAGDAIAAAKRAAR